MRSALLVMTLLSLLVVSYSARVPTTTNPVGTVNDAVFSLCSGLKGLLPPVAMLMVVLGAVIYAAGQIMGAETRARANVWATAALTGALIAMLIAAIAPPVLSLIQPGVNCDIFSP